MPLHIKDQAATDAVRRLARARKLTLTDAVRIACQEALERDERARPIADRPEGRSCCGPPHERPGRRHAG